MKCHSLPDAPCGLVILDEITASVCVTPDYLSVGSDSNFLRVPTNLHTATTVANRFGYVLPTPKIVDAIYEQRAIDGR